MSDITNREDVEILVKKFYDKLLTDDVVGHVFHQTIAAQIEQHLDVIVQFWCSVLLGEQSYKGNVMVKHIELNKQVKLEAHHFERWVTLWDTTIQELHMGKTADEAKRRATMMKELMLFKIRKSEEDGFIQ